MVSDVPRPCIECGELSTGTRCDDCRREHERIKYAKTGRRDRLPGHDDAAWRRLSKRARQLQPWCSDCGKTADELRAADKWLTVDHLPSAWAARENNKAILLSMVDVLCNTCNTRRGSSRPGSERYEKWLSENRESHESGNRRPEK